MATCLKDLARWIFWKGTSNSMKCQPLLEKVSDFVLFKGVVSDYLEKSDKVSDFAEQEILRPAAELETRNTELEIQNS